MKILIFNWRCWLNPDAGGAEVFTREVAKRWANAGNTVTLFTAEFQGCKCDEFLDGVRIVRAGGRFSIYHKAKEYYRNLFSKEAYDIVVDEINTRPFSTPKFVRRGETIFALIHQLAREYWLYETPFPLSIIGYYYLENKWLKKYVNIPVITISESTKSDLTHLGFKKVFVVPEGLNFEPLDTLPNKEPFPVVVYAGRLKRAKRPDHAIRAFKIIKKRIKNAELWIIGDGNFKKKLEKLACEGIRFFSSLNDLQRRELIKRAWILVNPSVREGWGLNVIEANALGLPAVVYDVPGLRDSVKNYENGLLVKNGSVEDLAEKIMVILEDDLLRERLGETALANSRSFSWDKCAELFLRIIGG